MVARGLRLRTQHRAQQRDGARVVPGSQADLGQPQPRQVAPPAGVPVVREGLELLGGGGGLPLVLVERPEGVAGLLGNAAVRGARQRPVAGARFLDILLRQVAVRDAQLRLGTDPRRSGRASSRTR